MLVESSYTTLLKPTIKLHVHEININKSMTKKMEKLS